MDSVKIAEFLFSNIRQTIAKKKYIKEVKIGYSFEESYGNRYITLTYKLVTNADFRKLPLQHKHTMFQDGSRYVYSISSNKQSKRTPPINRVVAFRNIYESVTAYATLQLEANLLPNTAIKIESIHLWPDANYAEKYLDELIDSKYSYHDISKLKIEINQWESLHQLAIQSKEKISGEKYLVSDLEILKRWGIPADEIRQYVVSRDIPIKVKGVKIITEILISVPALLQTLKTDTSLKEYRPHFIKLISRLYEYYLPDEKADIIQRKKAAYLQDFVIQPGDLVVLNNNRIVQATSISMDKDHLLHIAYTILKSNLQAGDRTRTVPVSDISSVLKATDYKEYLRNNSVHRLPLLKRWMEKKKIIVTVPAFDPDF